MAHTPGPWKAIISGGNTFWQQNQPRIYSGNKEIGIAKYYLPNFVGDIRPDDSEIEANAMLMAAAPELLEVCLEVAMEPYPDSDLASLLETLRARAKSAIAKTQPNKPINATVDRRTINNHNSPRVIGGRWVATKKTTFAGGLFLPRQSLRG